MTSRSFCLSGIADAALNIGKKFNISPVDVFTTRKKEKRWKTAIAELADNLTGDTTSCVVATPEALTSFLKTNRSVYQFSDLAYLGVKYTADLKLKRAVKTTPILSKFKAFRVESANLVGDTIITSTKSGKQVLIKMGVGKDKQQLDLYNEGTKLLKDRARDGKQCIVNIPCIKLLDSDELSDFVGGNVVDRNIANAVYTNKLDMDETGVGARAFSVVVVKLGKSEQDKPRIITIDKPFMLVIADPSALYPEFVAYCAKDCWVVKS